MNTKAVLTSNLGLSKALLQEKQKKIFSKAIKTEWLKG